MASTVVYGDHQRSDETALKQDSVTSSMYYLERLPLYDTEKPYTMRYEPDEDIPQSNFKKVPYPMVVKSMREQGVESFRINECGFQLVHLDSALSYDEFWDSKRVEEVYIKEVKDMLKRELGAKFAVALDFAVRKRHESFPVSTGEEYKYDQPTALAHIDFTFEEGERIIKVLFGDRADELLGGHWQAVNVWKPIKGPLNDWPLGLCDTRSVDYERDTIPADVVFDNFVTENVQIIHSPDLQWYYLPDHNTTEALIFKNGDSKEGPAAGCPHSGFFNPKAVEGEKRESLDCRCFVFYADLDEYPPIVGDVYQPHAQL